MQNINMNLMKYFYYVAKYCSYTKAAEILMISQPSLSYSIKVLELQLNKKLFNRGKRIELTSYGKYLYEQVNQMMTIFDNLESDSEIKGKITIGMRSQYVNKIFPLYISELNNIYPSLQIEYISAKSDKLKDLLYSGNIDILIDEYEFYGIYESFLQLDDDIIFIKDINNPEVIDDQYFKSNKICIVNRNKITKEIIKEYDNFDFLEFQSTPIMLNVIFKKQLIAITPKSIVKEYLDNGKIIEIKTKYNFPSAKMYITYNKKLKNKNIEAVVNFFREHTFYDLNK